MTNARPKVRRLYRRRNAKCWKQMKLMRSFTYMGFKVELWNNRARSFRYEWKLRPLTQLAKHASKNRKGQFCDVIHDPTSMPTQKGAMLYGKHAAMDSIFSIKWKWDRY